MFPTLHDTVETLLSQDSLYFTFHTTDDDTYCTEDYDTNIMGYFECKNKACPKRQWSSKVIAITIRMYPNNQYNARVYHQRCKSCDHLSQPVPDGSYAERIAYRLKKWNGVEMEIPAYREGPNIRPHERELCEGCKHGHCKGGL